MDRTVRGRWGAAALGLIALTIFMGCGTTAIMSRWKGLEVVIARNDEAWLTAAAPVNDKRVSVAMYNDSAYFYIGLVTADRELQRIITRTGITWWFDREGGATKTFGVHYPVHGGPAPPPEGEPGEREAPPDAGLSDDRSTDWGELDIYASGEDRPVRMTIAASAGIEARYHVAKGTLSYVLKVPLRETASHPFAPNVAPGTTIGMGAETTVRRPVPPSAGEGRRPGGGGVPGGMRGGGGRAGTPQGRPGTESRPDPLQVWMKVELAPHK